MGKIRKIFTEVGPTLRRTCRRYPVEQTLSLFATVFLLATHWELSPKWMERMFLGMPIVFAATYIVNTLVR